MRCCVPSVVTHIRHNNLVSGVCACNAYACSGFETKCNLILISVGATTASLLLLQIYLSQFSFQHVKILAFLLDQKGSRMCGRVSAYIFFEFHGDETENKNRKID